MGGHAGRLVVALDLDGVLHDELLAGREVADLAEARDVPVLIRNRPDDDELFARLQEADADIIVANNWRTWIPPRIFGLPRHGTLNIHDSLLPKYAGFSPLIWALINGESEVGVTAHMMNDELDAGEGVERDQAALDPRLANELAQARAAGAAGGAAHRVVGRRLAVLRRLAHPDPADPATGPVDVVVAPVRSLLQPQVRGLGDLVPVGLVQGQECDPDEVVRRLVDRPARPVGRDLDARQFGGGVGHATRCASCGL